METSFFEIYNEKIHDLLAVSKGSQQNDKTNVSELSLNTDLSLPITVGLYILYTAETTNKL